ncbi:MAG: efflux RND transporter periplasmic adaptor subunit [Phycisphaeraceae bacterium]
MTAKTKTRLWQIAAVLLVLAVGGGLAAALTLTRDKAAQEPREVAAPAVRASRAATETAEVVIRGHGTAEAHTQVSVIPQVGGQIVELDPRFVAGGTFEAGETLIRIDPRDYRLRLEQAQDQVAEAAASLEAAEADIAAAEAQVADRREDADRLRELFDRDAATEREMKRAAIALQQAEASLEAARARRTSAAAALERARTAADLAELELDRTEISLPFAGRVLSEDVGLGQHIVSGQPVATVYATDRLEVPVPLEDQELRWFAVGPDRGAEAEVTTRFAGSNQVWRGRVVRMEGQIDPTTRMATVVVAVPAPDAGETPLLPGMFVDVAIRGRELEGVLPIPRHALREGGEVWTVDEDSRLHIQPVEIAWLDSEQAFVSGGLEPGQIVVTSNLDAVAEGMPVRVSLPDERQASLNGPAPSIAREGSRHE